MRGLERSQPGIATTLNESLKSRRKPAGANRQSRSDASLQPAIGDTTIAFTSSIGVQTLLMTGQFELTRAAGGTRDAWAFCKAHATKAGDAPADKRPRSRLL